MMTIKETLKNKENPVVKVYPVCGRVEAVVYENNVETGESGMVKTGEVSGSVLAVYARKAA